MKLGHEEPLLNITSENQIIAIHDQLLNLDDEERKFLSIFNSIKERIEKKDKIIQLFCIPQPENTKPNYYRNKKLYREQQIQDAKSEPIYPVYKKIKKPPIISAIEENVVIFEFASFLPTSFIESQRGWKYQNPARCKWKINRDDAIEFETKGYGKIIQN
jgi:hypothetical protein